MSGAAPLLFHNPWTAMAAALGAFVLLFAGLHGYARTSTASAELTRKLLHTGSGLLTLTFPFLFQRVWPVLVLTGASALLLAAVKIIPALRVRLGTVAHRVERTTLGEIYFPVSVALLFWLNRAGPPLLFVIPVLMLTIADATGAIVGRRYGLIKYSGASKSLEGSVAFVVAAFFCGHVPLLLWSEVGRTESLLIAATLALLVMLLEGSAWRGLDNLFIPIGGYLLLRAYLPLDAAALLARFVVTTGLVAVVLRRRNRTTLEDDSLLAGAFLSYVAWALMGWRWLIAPAAVFVGFSWLSPPTPDNSRRIHAVPALLSVWAPAIAWLAVARSADQPRLLVPYTVVFAAHLAMFGLSRLASQFPGRALAPLFWRAILTSWAVVMIPFAAGSGVNTPAIAAAIIAIGAMTVGTALFMLTQPNLRDVPLTRRRWISQSLAAALSSVTAWAVLETVSQARP